MGTLQPITQKIHATCYFRAEAQGRRAESCPRWQVQRDTNSNQQLSTNNFQPTTFNQQLSTNNLQPTTFNQQPSTNNLQLATNNFQPTTFNQQPSTNNLQPTTFNQQPSTSNQQRTSNNQQRSPSNPKPPREIILCAKEMFNDSLKTLSSIEILSQEQSTANQETKV
jgi:hypothetical protein